MITVKASQKIFTYAEVANPYGHLRRASTESREAASVGVYCKGRRELWK